MLLFYYFVTYKLENFIVDFNEVRKRQVLSLFLSLSLGGDFSYLPLALKAICEFGFHISSLLDKMQSSYLIQFAN